MNIINTITLALFINIAITASAYAIDGIKISNAWVPQGPPVIKVMAGYLVAENATDKPVSIVKVSSSVFEKVEMHKSITKDGLASMVRQDKVTIPAKSEIEFKSGGLHLMLIGKKDKLITGSKVPLVIELDNGQQLSVTAMVKSAGTDTIDHSHHHH